MRAEFKICVELMPFEVPDNIHTKPKPGLRQDGLIPAVTFKLSDVPREVLEGMCKEFQDTVMKKAGYSESTMRQENAVG